MSAKETMKIGVIIANKLKLAVDDMLKVKPDLTIQEALHGTHTWLAAEIMKALESNFYRENQ